MNEQKKLVLYYIRERALTWHRKPFQKPMFWHFDRCIPSQLSGQRRLETKRLFLSAQQTECLFRVFFCKKKKNYSMIWLKIIWSSSLLFLTILKYADEGDDDQQVDVLHHCGVHDASWRKRWKERLRETCVQCAFTARCTAQTWSVSLWLHAHLQPTNMFSGFLFM